MKMFQTAVLVLVACIAASAQISVTVSSQGTDAIKQTTGYAPKTATLVRLDICNNGDATSVSTSRINAAIISQEQYGVYSSDVVEAVLNVLQGRDAFTRAQKIISAGGNTITLLSALFKTFSPITISALQVAPEIAQAILPAVGDPRDLASLEKQIMADNATLALGKKGSGNDCHTGLVVAMTPTAKIDTLTLP